MSAYSAIELATSLDLPRPTDQQIAVIEAPLSPVLVVAGAGSGKTETMASRVVWLLANREVTVGEILGLTFTRKAAGELGQRIGKRVEKLRSVGILEATEDELFDRPNVSTYNSFANALFRDNALLVGREPESVLLSEASAWRLARRIVVKYGDDRIAALGKRVDTVTEIVLELSHELAEIEGTTQQVSDFAERFIRLANLPTGSARKASNYASVDSAVNVIGALPVLIELAERYADEKRRQGLVEFSDQVALALDACERSDRVVAAQRSRYRAVLLDEYQDTSVVQTRLLSTLFADHAVMAVGDPHQSIYGWRGASAANLARFSDDFGRTAPATGYNLSTSWRNDQAILDAANVLVRPLQSASRTDEEAPREPDATAAAAAPTSAVAVLDLEARPGAGAGRVESAFVETIGAEAALVAEWFADRLLHTRGGDPSSTAAILFRARRPMQAFAAALEERGVPHHILGLGGLLSTPEVVDVVAALRVVHDPSAGSSLIRLLAGPRWRIGVRDLGQLMEVARYLQAVDWKTGRYDAALAGRLRESVADDDGRSVIDGLDFLAGARLPDSLTERFSEEGFSRLKEAGAVLASLRRRAGSGLPDLVRMIERELRLDIEVMANESGGSTARAEANLHAFHDQLTAFLASDEDATLGSFLSWIDRALQRDNMAPATEAPDHGAVQLLTVHGSKGLEWDHVAVPRLVAGELPAAPRDGLGWVSLGKLPYDFRGDASELPRLAWQGVESQQEFDHLLPDFKQALRDRSLDEERRLAYVAVTRARFELLLTGSFWSTGKTPRKPSPYLQELAEVGLIGELPEYPEHEENPIDDATSVLQWPMDPLGSRRVAVERAAAAVEHARTALRQGTVVTELGALDRDLALLLEEQRRIQQPAPPVELPTRVQASRFKEFVTDPEAVLERLRRPVPQRPFRQTRLGTMFHSWVEEYYGMHGLQDLVEPLPWEAFSDEDDDSDVGGGGGGAGVGVPLTADQAEGTPFEDIAAAFLASEWAGIRPVEVETEIHVPLGDTGRVVICKLDAVFERDGRYEIVDWKTGAVPDSEESRRNAFYQLALYRLAYAHHRGIDPDLIDAVLYYVTHDVQLRPERLYSEEELLSDWAGSMGRVAESVPQRSN
ncbi:UvrD-helicase domain-containing protein [Plantibacter sp. Mn2098]|uniref:UvrD-helicase domain-containing protein n=1 Tax=Plantibacter sp. Mn2098 TaxID=3395266 RepID=UPI003BC4D686